MMYEIFCDLDGVLADFNRGVKELTGSFPNDLGDKQMWPAVARAPRFYADLPWMPDGKELWDYIKKHNPTILTGLPFGKWANPQKREWVGREIGWGTKVITCWSKEKHLHCNGSYSILIDDRKRLMSPWEEAGGIFILHKRTIETLERLQELGL